MTLLILIGIVAVLTVPGSCELPEASLPKMLQDADPSAQQHSVEEVPRFMTDLHEVLSGLKSSYSSTSRERQYSHGPVIKAVPVEYVWEDSSTYQMQFPLPTNLKTGDEFSVEVMVNCSHAVTATYNNAYLERIERRLTDNFNAFNLKSAVTELLQNNDTSVALGFSEHLDRADVYLVIYEHISPNHIFHARRRRHSDRLRNMYLFLRNVDHNFTSTNFHPHHCKRVPWRITFRSLEWNFIINPDTPVDFGACSGGCNLFSSNINTTNYSFLKEVYVNMQHARNTNRENIPDGIEAARCVPARFHPLQVLYSNYRGAFTSRILPEMIVSSCTCR